MLAIQEPEGSCSLRSNHWSNAGSLIYTAFCTEQLNAPPNTRRNCEAMRRRQYQVHGGSRVPQVSLLRAGTQSPTYTSSRFAAATFAYHNPESFTVRFSVAKSTYVNPNRCV